VNKTRRKRKIKSTGEAKQALCRKSWTHQVQGTKTLEEFKGKKQQKRVAIIWHKKIFQSPMLYLRALANYLSLSHLQMGLALCGWDTRACTWDLKPLTSTTQKTECFNQNGQTWKVQ